MRNIALLKLKDNLTIYEASDYLAGVMGVEIKFSSDQIMGFLNEGKLNLYLNPNGLHERRQPQVSYGREFENNVCELRGEQRFTSVYLDNCADTLHVKAGVQIVGDVFVGDHFPGLSDVEIAKALSLKNKVFTDKVATITKTLHQSYEDGENFFYIKREEIDSLIAPAQSGHEPQAEQHLREVSELNAKIKVLEDEKEELKTQLNTKSRPAKSQLLVIARAYELYSKGKESTHTQAAFNAELRDGNDLHGLKERTINGLLSEAAKTLDQERKR